MIAEELLIKGLLNPRRLKRILDQIHGNREGYDASRAFFPQWCAITTRPHDPLCNRHRERADPFSTASGVPLLRTLVPPRRFYRLHTGTPMPVVASDGRPLAPPIVLREPPDLTRFDFG